MDIGSVRDFYHPPGEVELFRQCVAFPILSLMGIFREKLQNSKN
jgi:hypothetical protein